MFSVTIPHKEAALECCDEVDSLAKVCFFLFNFGFKRIFILIFTENFLRIFRQAWTPYPVLWRSSTIREGLYVHLCWLCAQACVCACTPAPIFLHVHTSTPACASIRLCFCGQGFVHTLPVVLGRHVESLNNWTFLGFCHSEDNLNLIVTALFVRGIWGLQAVGAVNTIVRRKGDGKLIGYNTDCEGAITAIEDGLRGRCQGKFIWRLSLLVDFSSATCQFFPGGEKNKAGTSPLLGRYFVVIGAGGAGKALAYGAKHRGAKVIIANRSYGKICILLAENIISAYVA